MKKLGSKTITHNSFVIRGEGTPQHSIPSACNQASWVGPVKSQNALTEAYNTEHAICSTTRA